MDIEYWNGPLSPYFNSLVFRVFGESIFVIEIVNIFLLGIFAIFLYSFYDKKNKLTSIPIITTSFIVLFAFAQYVTIGNYNYVTPYSHELTHGILIGFVSIYLLARYSRNRNIKYIGLIGFCAGLSLLTKIEVAIATTASLVTSLLVLMWIEKIDIKRLTGITALFIIGVITPVLAFVIYFSASMPYPEALGKIFMSWLIVTHTDVSKDAFYQYVMGTDDVLFNVKAMLMASSFYAVLAVPLIANHLLRNSAFIKRFGTYISFASVLLLFGILKPTVPWFEIFRPLPVILMIVSVALFIILITSSRTDNTPSLISFFAMSVFSLMLLLKMILNVHIFHYGFALAMPATLLFLYGFSHGISSVISKISGTDKIYKGFILGVFTVMLLWHADRSLRSYSLKNLEVSKWPDTIVGYAGDVAPEPTGVKLTLDAINEIMTTQDDFVVFPHGVMLNYLSKRENPSGYLNFLPAEQMMFGEDRMLERLKSSSPEFVVLVHGNASDDGFVFFGRDYGVKIFSWIKSEYVLERQIGAEPFKSNKYGIQILRKKTGLESYGEG